MQHQQSIHLTGVDAKHKTKIMLTISIKRIKLLSLAMLSVAVAKADEGMWPVEAIPSSIVKQMRADGAGKLLDGNQLRQQRAVVIFGRGCTGSFISEQGLLLTNHHCASDYLKQLSKDANNLLRDGFIAQNKQQELPVPGLTISILEHVRDVTHEADSLRKLLSNKNAMFVNRRIVYVLEKKFFHKMGYECDINTEATTGKTKLYAYRVFNDVRLVAAPPMSMGRLGGNADNFEWERYQLDFSIFRVYANSKGKNAEYHPSNTPFHPKCWFSMSKQKVKKGMPLYTVGYPGSTSRYLTSEQIRTSVATTDSVTAAVRSRRLSLYSDPLPLTTQKDREVHEDIFAYANSAKVAEGRFNGYQRENIFKVVKDEETMLPQEQKMLVDEVNRLTIAIRPIVNTHTTLVEAMLRGTSILIPGMRAGLIVRAWNDSATRAKAVANMVSWYDEYLNQNDLSKEQQLLELQLQNLSHAPLLSKSPVLYKTATLNEQQRTRYVDSVFSTSIFTSKERLMTFTKNGTLEQLVGDPIYIMATETYNLAVELKKDADVLQDSIHAVKQQLWQKRRLAGIRQSPDANFTMRLSTGTAQSAISYSGEKKPMATTFGDLTRIDGTKPAYNVDKALIKAVSSSRTLAKQTLCFTSTNDITGGNSGSPVLDKDGRIVGLAFDGNYESLLGDIRYIKQHNRCISLSVRAVEEYLKVVAPNAEISKRLM